jgi:hypothetical protein
MILVRLSLILVLVSKMISLHFSLLQAHHIILNLCSCIVDHVRHTHLIKVVILCTCVVSAQILHGRVRDGSLDVLGIVISDLDLFTNTSSNVVSMLLFEIVNFLEVVLRGLTLISHSSGLSSRTRCQFFVKMTADESRRSAIVECVLSK